MKYPKHIYDPVRYEVASSIISHELKKIFPRCSEKEFEKLQKQIYAWPLKPEEFSLTVEPRDFWNGVEGIMTGFRLKGIVRFLTAENVIWTKETVDPKEVILTTDHFFIKEKKIPTLNKSAQEVLNWLKDNDLVEAALEKVESSYDTPLPRVLDPVYGKKDAEGTYYVHDGNGRILYALLKNIPSVTAFAGELKDEKPNNYWIPTMLLIHVSKLHNHNVLERSEYKRILESFFEVSQAARIEYKERVPDDTELKKYILN